MISFCFSILGNSRVESYYRHFSIINPASRRLKKHPSCIINAATFRLQVDFIPMVTGLHRYLQGWPIIWGKQALVKHY